MAKTGYMSARATRRAYLKNIIENQKNIKVVRENESFLNIKQDLIDLNWINEEDNFINSFELSDKLVMEQTPALRLVNEIYNMTLKPHLNGIEISRFEIFSVFQGKGFASKFLDHLLLFLISKGVKEIYVMPIPAGIFRANGLANNKVLLESIFYKRGFRLMHGQPYWILSDMTYLDSIFDIEIDYNLLKK